MKNSEAGKGYLPLAELPTTGQAFGKRIFCHSAKVRGSRGDAILSLIATGASSNMHL